MAMNAFRPFFIAVLLAALLAGATDFFAGGPDFFAVPSSVRPVWRGNRKPCACAVPSSVRPVWRGELPFGKGAAL